MDPASTGTGDGDRHVRGNFRVTPSVSESTIFDLLRSVAARSDPAVKLQVLGEWVLSKILGQDPGRLYIGVSGMPARIYCDKVMEHIVESKIWGVTDMRNLRQVGAPCIMLSGKSVYFLSLKSGTYTGVGHNRVMERPYDSEDLYHADLTINSLLYNINNSTLEDITGKGFEDLKNGMVITTSQALQSITKDPLIILRSVRFASQLNFTLHESLIRAGGNSRVKADLGFNISRERINREVSLMLASKHPVRAMKFVEEMGLFSTIFTFPGNSKPPIDDNCARSCIAILEEFCKLLDSIGNSFFTGNVDQMAQVEQRLIFMYAALFLELSETVYVDQNNEKASVVSIMLQNTQLISGHESNSGPLKPVTRNIVLESVSLIHKSCSPFAELFALIESNNGLDMIKVRLQDKFEEISSSLVKRILAGQLLKEVKELWRICLLLSIILYAKPVSNQDMSQRKMDLYIRIEKDIVDLGVEKIWEITPLLDQKSITHHLDLQPNDPTVKEWQERLVMWQIAHPTGTENEFIDWMKQFNCRLKEIPSVLVTLKNHFRKASLKINSNENQLLERVALLSGMFAVRMKDDCCRIVTNWIEVMNGEHVANRSWDGKFSLDSFGIDNNRVCIIDVPRLQATSDARCNDRHQLALQLGKVLVLDGELPAYLGHLLGVLKSRQRGPLTESLKLAYETHFSLLPSENRIALTYLFKLKLDCLLDAERKTFIILLNKCKLGEGWLVALRKIPIFKKVIEGGEELNDCMYSRQNGHASFKLLRHYFTHAPEHSGETGMSLLTKTCVLDLTAWKHLGNFAAQVVFTLISEDADIKREARCSQLR